MVAAFVELVARGALEALSIGALLATLWVVTAFVGLWLGATFRARPAAGPVRPGARGRTASAADAGSGA